MHRYMSNLQAGLDKAAGLLKQPEINIIVEDDDGRLVLWGPLQVERTPGPPADRAKQKAKLENLEPAILRDRLLGMIALGYNAFTIASMLALEERRRGLHPGENAEPPPAA